MIEVKFYGDDLVKLEFIVCKVVDVVGKIFGVVGVCDGINLVGDVFEVNVDFMCVVLVGFDFISVID